MDTGLMSALQMSNLLKLIELGGPIVAVLLIMSVFGLAIVLLKVWQFAAARVGRRRFIDPALDDWQAHRFEAALERLEGERNPIARTLTVAMRGMAAGVDNAVVREESARVGARQLAGLRSYFRPLELIGSLAPLLGLLGTVLGMISVFGQLASAGGQVDPSMLSGGIWEALLTTAVGLIVAVPAVLALNWLERIVERLHEDMQDALTRVFTHHETTLMNEADAPANEAPAEVQSESRYCSAASYAH